MRGATAFDGEGARLFPGRWNHVHVPVVYCASSLSLATLEYFVHLDPDDIPSDLVAIRAKLPSHDVGRLDAKRLPLDWRRYPAPNALKELGDEWVRDARPLALLVPSAVTPIEDNVLINPKHPRFASLELSRPEPFAFDPRIVKRTK